MFEKTLQAAASGVDLHASSRREGKKNVEAIWNDWRDIKYRFRFDWMGVGEGEGLRDVYEMHTLNEGLRDKQELLTTYEEC